MRWFIINKLEIELADCNNALYRYIIYRYNEVDSINEFKLSTVLGYLQLYMRQII